MSITIADLKPREQRGSRARCLLMTTGSREMVAARLTALVEPFAMVDPARHTWMPGGVDAPREARLGEAPHFLASGHREQLLAWWLAVRQRANSPNWDLAATATIGGREGLVLIEAKAHSGELSRSGCAATNMYNARQITRAIQEANAELNGVLPGWSLSAATHYQLANRFAVGWRIATLGVPVVLVYLGFLDAEELTGTGREVFRSEAGWDEALRGHARGTVPADAWERAIRIRWTALLIRSLAVSSSISAPAVQVSGCFRR
jgi:hypothetical protein